jgi:uncharacterized protein YkwD
MKRTRRGKMKNEKNRTPKAAIRKAGAITLMTATAALTMMNPVFADTASGGQSAEQSVKKAAVQQSSGSSLDSAKKAVSSAESAKAESRSRLEQARSDLADAQEAESRAEKKMTKAQKESSDAEDKMNEAFNGLDEKYEKELEEKKDAEAEAKERYEAAAYEQDTADSEEDSSNDEETADEDGHSEEYYEAQEALDEAIDRRDSLKEQADEYLEESEDIGADFIDSRTSDGCSLEDWRQTLEDSSLSEYATDDVFDRARDNLSTSNLRKSIKLMKECNELRAKKDNWKGAAGELSVNYDLMVFSAVSSAVSAEKMENGGGLGHVLFNSRLRSSGFNYGGRAENLAWGYSDPFRGWYDREKSRYYQLLDSGVENPNSSNYSEVGHFTNMTDPHWTLMGLTAGTVSELVLASRSGSDATVSISEFEDALDEYTAESDEKYDEINQKYQEACSDVEEKEQELENIAAEEQSSADDEDSSDETVYDESTDEEAEDLDQLRQEYEDAVTAREEAEKMLEAVDSVDRDDPDTYSIFPGLVELVEDFEAKKKAADEACVVYDEARTKVDEAEDVLAAAKKEYRRACEALETAEANYEEALKKARVGTPKITVKAGRRLVKVSIKKVSGAEKYQIKIKKSHGSWKTYTVRGTKKTIRRLSKGRKYYLKVRTIGKNGTKSVYSRTKAVRVR